MKILQVGHNYHIVGGSDAVFFATSSLLENAGHEVIPFCIDNPKNHPSRWSEYFPKGADSRTAALRDGLDYFFNHDARTKLNHLLDAAGPIDVAHLHIYHGKHTASILPVLRARHIPIIQTLHEYKLACPVYTMQRQNSPCDLCIAGSDLNAIRHRCKDHSVIRSLVMVAEKATSRLLGDVRLVDRFICVSDFQRQIMVRAGLPADRLHTLHNFVETGTKPGAGHDGYFLYFGRIEALKGVGTLVEAFKRSGRRLLIAGDGDWRPSLEAAIQSTDKIKYLGFQSGSILQDLIRRAQAVVVPSQWNENCPMSVLEAKALGRPVIGAKIGGIPELVRHGRDGYLFEPGDVAGLVTAITALEDTDHRKMAGNALRDTKTRFSAQSHLRSLLIHYSDIIEGSKFLALQPA